MATAKETVRESSVQQLLMGVVSAYRKLIKTRNISHLLITLAIYVANRLPTNPVWVQLVGPSSSGKTETLEILRGLPRVFQVGTLTEAGLLSGSPGREKDPDATGGLLREIGEKQTGLLVCKDFTSVLSEHRDTQKSLLAALREIHDGAWSRHIGTDGGLSLAWKGKIGVIGGVTPEIDAFNDLRIVMGERFLLHRIRTGVSNSELARFALGNNGHGRQLRELLYSRVAELLKSVIIPKTLPSTPGEVLDRLVSLSELVVDARCVVRRDNERDIVSATPTELSPRLALQLQTLYLGLSLIGCEEKLAWNVIRKTGLDSMTEIRRIVLETLANCEHGSTVAGITGVHSHLVKKTVKRTLDEFTVIGITDEKLGAGSCGTRWRLTDKTRSLWNAIHTPLEGGDSESEDGSPEEITIPTETTGLPSDEELIEELLSHDPDISQAAPEPGDQPKDDPRPFYLNADLEKVYE